MDIEIQRLCCCTCGILFWITEKHYSHLLKCHNTFYCPNGHSNVFAGKTEAEKQKERAEKAEIRADRFMRELTDAKKSNSALRGAMTRQKNKSLTGGQEK